MLGLVFWLALTRVHPWAKGADTFVKRELCRLNRFRRHAVIIMEGFEFHFFYTYVVPLIHGFAPFLPLGIHSAAHTLGATNGPAGARAHRSGRLSLLHPGELRWIRERSFISSSCLLLRWARTSRSFVRRDQ